jgi:hypothetical protein
MDTLDPAVGTGALLVVGLLWIVVLLWFRKR